MTLRSCTSLYLSKCNAIYLHSQRNSVEKVLPLQQYLLVPSKNLFWNIATELMSFPPLNQKIITQFPASVSCRYNNLFVH